MLKKIAESIQQNPHVIEKKDLTEIIQYKMKIMRDKVGIIRL